jgi:hypothetical protein
MPFFSLSLVDAFGRRTTKRIEVETQILLADYQAIATDVAGKLDAITDLQLVRMDLVLSMGETFDVVAGANVDVGGTFTGRIDGGEGKQASHKVPGFKLGKVDPDGTIDLTDADVDAYLDLYLAAGGTLLLSDGEQMEAWVKGHLDR